MFLERDTATLAVVRDRRRRGGSGGEPKLAGLTRSAELQDMVAGLDAADEPPQAVFMVGSGVDVAALKAQIVAAATTLPVHAPEGRRTGAGPWCGAGVCGRTPATRPPRSALVRQTARARRRAVYSAACTEMSAGATQMAAAGYMAPLGYSEVPDEDAGY